MENASKALIMAGSILIALITIGALIFMFDSISGVERQKDQNAEIEAVLEFNKQFEAFDAVGLRGSDLITVMNKIINYNEKVEEEQQGYNKLSMTIKMDDGTEYTLNENNSGNLRTKYNDWFGKKSSEMTGTEAQEELKEFKRKYFKCTNVGYDNISGRVNSMSFKEIVVQ